MSEQTSTHNSYEVTLHTDTAHGSVTQITQSSKAVDDAIAGAHAKGWDVQVNIITPFGKQNEVHDFPAGTEVDFFKVVLGV